MVVFVSKMILIKDTKGLKEEKANKLQQTRNESHDPQVSCH